jgi:hypothetical protein
MTKHHVPDPHAAAEFWRTACFMLSAFSLIVGGAIGFGVGNLSNRDAQQAELNAEHYRTQALERDSVADACTAAFEALAWDAYVALVYTQSAHEVMEAFLGQHPRPRAEYVAETSR